MIFILKLKELREQKGYSQAKLGELANVPLRTIQDLERRGDGRISTLSKLASALKVSLDEIYQFD